MARIKRPEHTAQVKLDTQQLCSTLTFRYSTGLVTLNLSMVEMMMAGVVRKKSRMKRTMLMIRHRIHQETPPTDRCSLWDKGYAAVRLTLGQDPQLWTQLASKLILQLKNQFVIWR